MGKSIIRICLLVFLAILCSSCFGQSIIRVSTSGNDSNNGSSWALAKKTVQAGINAANSAGGGEVWVSAGVYNERITCQAKCYLYGGFAGTETQRSQRNFFINKIILDGKSNGHCVSFATSTGTNACIDGFTIRNGGSLFYGINCNYASPTIANNTISGSSQGIYCSSSSPVITNNIIYGNSDHGINCSYSNSNPIIANNIIYGNGNGIICSTNPAVINNTIYGNNCGVFCTSGSPSIANNIIAYNGTGIVGNSATPTLKRNCVYGNTKSYDGLSAGTTDIASDPLLADWRFGNAHIQTGSPCINAGDGSVIDASWHDIDGQARTQAAGVDIGADESDGTLWTVDAPTVFHVSPNGNNSNDGLSWAAAKKTVQAGIDAAYSNGGGEVWVAAGVYIVYPTTITLKSACYVYGGFVGTENNRSERNFSSTKSILDGTSSGYGGEGPVDVVSAKGLGPVTCIDGFTIRNGNSGIYCDSSSPIIANNILSNNSNGIYSPLTYWNGTYKIPASPTIVNNIIFSNLLSGINSECVGTPTVINNTISGNGCGIAMTGSSPTIANNIVAFNGGGISGAATPTLKRNCVYGNRYTNAVGTTDIVADPLLENWWYGNLHIQPGSPCIDAGDQSVVDVSWLDMDCKSRIQGSSVDIGADESDGTLWPVNPHLIVRVKTTGNDSNDGSGWALAKKTVQAAIDAAYDNGGGEVWVAAGTYAERITLKANCDIYGGFAGTENEKSQRNSTINKSIFDGSSGGNVVTSSGMTTTASIDGFTIKNSGSSFSGIYCEYGSPIISNNVISSTGKGIYCALSSSPAIANNTIIRNSSYGIYSDHSSPSITNNVISWGDNNGVSCYSSADVKITGNTIIGNAYNAIYCSDSSPAINNNNISTNGSGIDCESSSPQIINNTITGNNSGILCGPSSSPHVFNNIIAFNSTGISKTDGTPLLNNNCVYGNTTEYSGLAAGANDISEDPMLENWKYGKVHIQPGSPCIDAGDGSVVNDSWLDVDGQSRIQGAAVDIGCDESNGTLWAINPSSVFYVKPTGNDTSTGTSWSLAKRTVQAGIDAAYNNGGGEVWVAAGTYYERIALKVDCDIYGGFAGTENQRSERNFNLNTTILDGTSGGNVVTVTGMTTIARIDGFAIRNGGGSNNGVYSYASSSPTITNNTFSGTLSCGISCYRSTNPLITNNIVTKGGISCSSVTGGVVSCNTISGASYGISCSSSSNLLISNNIVLDSQFDGIKCTSSNPVIANNIISGINANGISCYSSSPAITNNTLIKNNIGINSLGTSAPAITNNIIAFNTTGISKGTGAATLNRNCVYGNTSNYIGLSAGATDIAEDPLLVSWRYSKLHIQPDSPCIDAGDGSAINDSWLDMDGQSRIQGSSVDIGADESDGTQWTFITPVFYVSPNGNDTNNGTSWALAKKKVQSAIDAAYNGGGGEIWVAAGTYNERITLKTNCDLYGGFVGTETNRFDRNFGVNKSILDGSGGGVVVNAGSVEMASIDGFTIRNSGSGWAGVDCYVGNPTVTNNIITGNGTGINCYITTRLVIANNTICKNSKDGIKCSGTSPKIINNTISGNGNYGINSSSATLALTNNIIAFNVTGIYNTYNGVTATLNKNCVFGNTTNYYNITAGATDITKDPLFRDRLNGDFHLISNSLCIDAGDDTVISNGWLDMDYESRITGSHVDIGADEFQILLVTGVNAKGVGDSIYLQLNNMVVSSVYDGFYYVQDKNRSYGIRVYQVAGSMPLTNTAILVKGVLSSTLDGERCLLSYETPVGLGNQPVLSVMSVCKSIGGGDYSDSVTHLGQKGVIGGNGLNNIGLLLTVCGKVSSIDGTAKRIIINDGSADVTIYYGNIVLPDSVSVGKLIRATGACSCYKLGNGGLDRLVLLKDVNSIATLN